MNLDLTTFDGFAKTAFERHDISRFKDSFGHMLDINGAVPSYTVGFHIALDDEGDPDGTYTAQAKDVIKTFSPAVIYAGTKGLQARLAEMGHSSVLFPWFEDGAFAVVLKVPANAVINLKAAKIEK